MTGIAEEAWLALVIGNSRLHWGSFSQAKLLGAWHTPHLGAEVVGSLIANGFSAQSWQAIAKLTLTKKDALPPAAISPAALWIASVVPDQAALWLKASSSVSQVPQVVERSHIPLSGLYPTFGLDRAMTLLGAGSTLGWPVLVIDGGTALTFTAGAHQRVYGGAILPGMRLQSEALGEQTAALREPSRQAFTELIHRESIEGFADLPVRWASDTTGAIASGLLYGAIATLTDYLIDWWQRFPLGKAVITGGDGPVLHSLLQQRTPEIASRVPVDSDLMFWGISAYRQAWLSPISAD
jgi:type III pantothenate kinase